MKATGIVRKVDELGRVVLPLELRRNLDINGLQRKEYLCEFFGRTEKIVIICLSKHWPIGAGAFCSTED